MNPLADVNSAVLLLALIVTLGYLSTCWLWPFKACKRCHGTGKLRSPIIKAIRLCPHCPNASGLRLRTGRKLFNTYRRLHRAHHRDRNDRHHRDQHTGQDTQEEANP